MRNEANEFSCEMTDPMISLPNQRILSVNGNNLINFTQSRVTSVKISSAIYLPLGFSAFFLNIVHYETTGTTGLKEISRSVFRDLPKLESLTLEGNELSEIPEDVFEDLKELETLDLAYNQIVNLPDNLFFMQLNLRVLILSGNKLHSLTKTLLENCLNLKVIALGGNSFKMISPELILKFPNLRSAFSRTYPCLTDLYDPNFIRIVNRKCNRNCASLIENLEHFKSEAEKCSKSMLLALEENKRLKNDEKTCIWD